MPNWESFVDRLLRTENCEVFISGSSANLLSKEIATQLRGRSLSWELFPFSFGEFLNHNKVHVGKHLDSKERLHVQKLFNHYWENGGFPEVATVEKKLRVRIHQEYFNSIIYRDIIERYDLSHPRGLKDLAAFLLDNISSLYSINNLTNYLQSLGHKIPKSSVSDYLLWLEDAYFLFTVRLFDASFKRSHANPKKIYCIDHSLVKSVSSGIMINSGHLLENLVFTALRRKLRDIFYYRTKDGKEVDFVVNSEEGHRLLIQVSESLRNQVTREREVRSLSNAMSELSVSKGYIVTRDEDELIEVDSSGVIQVIPIWKFLLDF
jgi:predicted AAA+ superfamily ATPase